MRAVYDPSGMNLVLIMEPLSEEDLALFHDGELKFGLCRMRGLRLAASDGLRPLDAPYTR